MATLYKFARISNISWSKLNRLKFTEARPNTHAIPTLCKSLDNSDEIMQKIKRHSRLKFLPDSHVSANVAVLQKFDICKKSALLYPNIFMIHTINLENYCAILQECGFVKLHPQIISRYRFYTQTKTIGELKKMHLISDKLNLEEHLMGHFGEWSRAIAEDSTFSGPLTTDSTTLHVLRMKLLRMYLMIRINLSPQRMDEIAEKHRVICHRSFRETSRILDILQNRLEIPNEVIVKNGFILAQDPENIQNTLKNVKTLCGADIEWVLRNNPTLLRRNYRTLLEVEKVLQKHGIAEAAQRRCFSVFTLNPETINVRLTELKQYPEFEALSSHLRFLYLVIYKEKAIARLMTLRSLNKKCTSLFHYIGSVKQFETHIQSFGDRTRCVDAVFEITKVLYYELKSRAESEATNATLAAGEAKSRKLREECENYENELAHDMEVDSKGCKRRKRVNKHKLHSLRRMVIERLQTHKYWRNSPTVSMVEVLHWLLKKFSKETIVDNIPTLLYPLPELQRILNAMLDARSAQLANGDAECTALDYFAGIDFTRLTDGQLLSLTIYSLEKEFHFSGNGVWVDGDAPKQPSLEKDEQSTSIHKPQTNET